jgi:hypothetical protein
MEGLVAGEADEWAFGSVAAEVLVAMADLGEGGSALGVGAVLLGELSVSIVLVGILRCAKKGCRFQM